MGYSERNKVRTSENALQGPLLEGSELAPEFMRVWTQKYNATTATMTRKTPTIATPAMLADESGVPNVEIV